jgi:hypothetical protein
MSHFCVICHVNVWMTREKSWSMNGDLAFEYANHDEFADVIADSLLLFSECL